MSAALRHGIDAYVLERTDCAHIVEAVKVLRSDRALHDVLSRGALAFARREFDWERRAGALAGFYGTLMRKTVEVGR